MRETIWKKVSLEVVPKKSKCWSWGDDVYTQDRLLFSHWVHRPFHSSRGKQENVCEKPIQYVMLTTSTITNEEDD